MACTEDFIQNLDTENMECSWNQYGQPEYFYKGKQCPLNWLEAKGYNPEACEEAKQRLFGNNQQASRGSGGFTIYVLPDAPCQKLPDGGMSCERDVRGDNFDFQPQGGPSGAGWTAQTKPPGDKGKGPSVTFASPGVSSNYKGNNPKQNYSKNIMGPPGGGGGGSSSGGGGGGSSSKFGGPPGNANFGSVPTGFTPTFGAGPVPAAGPAPASAAPPGFTAVGPAPAPAAPASGGGGGGGWKPPFGSQIGSNNNQQQGKKNKGGGGGSDCSVFEKPSKEAERLSNDLSYITHVDKISGVPYIMNVWRDGYWGPCGKNFIDANLAKKIEKFIEDKRRDSKWPYLTEQEFNDVRKEIMRKRELAEEFNKKYLDDVRAENKQKMEILRRKQQAYVRAGGEGIRQKIYEINQEGWWNYGTRKTKEGVWGAVSYPFTYSWRLLKKMSTATWNKTTEVFWSGVEYSTETFKNYTKPVLDSIRNSLGDNETIDELTELINEFDKLEETYTIYKKLIEGQADPEVLKALGINLSNKLNVQEMINSIQEDPQMIESLIPMAQAVLQEIHNTFRAMMVVSQSLDSKNKKIWDKTLEEYLEHIEKLNQVKPGEGKKVLYNFPVEATPYVSPISPDRYREEEDYNIFGALDNDIDVTTKLENLDAGYFSLRRALEYEMECTPDKLETEQFLRKKELKAQRDKMITRATNIGNLATYLRNKKESDKWQQRAFELLEDTRVLYEEAKQLRKDVESGIVRPCKGSAENDVILAEKLDEAHAEFADLADSFQDEREGNYDPEVLGKIFQEMTKVIEEMTVMAANLSDGPLFDKWELKVEENKQEAEDLLKEVKKDKQDDENVRAAEANEERAII